MAFYTYAGFWRRLVAYTIDGLIVGIVFIILAFIAGVAFFSGTISSGSNVWVNEMNDPSRMLSFTLWFWFFSTLTNIAYFTYFHGSSGRTPGKMLLGLQVVSVEGGPISFGTAFLRSVGYLVSSFVFCLGYIWIAFDKRKQGWHDKIAGTVVIIREKGEPSSGLSIPERPTSSPNAQDVKPPENNDN